MILFITVYDCTMCLCYLGTIVVQPEDATDSPFQGPEFFPTESCSSG